MTLYAYAPAAGSKRTGGVYALPEAQRPVLLSDRQQAILPRRARTQIVSLRAKFVCQRILSRHSKKNRRRIKKQES